MFPLAEEQPKILRKLDALEVKFAGRDVIVSHVMKVLAENYDRFAAMAAAREVKEDAVTKIDRWSSIAAFFNSVNHDPLTTFPRRSIRSFYPQDTHLRGEKIASNQANIAHLCLLLLKWIINEYLCDLEAEIPDGEYAQQRTVIHNAGQQKQGLINDINARLRLIRDVEDEADRNDRNFVYGFLLTIGAIALFVISICLVGFGADAISHGTTLYGSAATPIGFTVAGSIILAGMVGLFCYRAVRACVDIARNIGLEDVHPGDVDDFAQQDPEPGQRLEMNVGPVDELELGLQQATDHLGAVIVHVADLQNVQQEAAPQFPSPEAAFSLGASYSAPVNLSMNRGENKQRQDESKRASVVEGQTVSQEGQVQAEQDQSEITEGQQPQARI